MATNPRHLTPGQLKEGLMQLRWTVHLVTGARHQMRVCCAPGTTFGEIAAQLPIGSSHLVCGRVRVVDTDVVGLPPLLDGAEFFVVGAAPDSPTENTPAELRVLAVTAGPAAGQRQPLTPGTHRIGRSSAADIRITDPDVSRLHAGLQVGSQGCRASDLGSANGSRIDTDGNTHRIDHPVTLTSEDELHLGNSVLVVRPVLDEPLATRPLGNGVVAINRPPRFRPPHRLVTVTLPAAPTPRSRTRTAWLAALAPLVISAALAVAMQSPLMLLMGLLTPVILLANAWSDRRAVGTENRLSAREYAATLRALAEETSDALQAEARRRRDAVPDPAQLADLARRRQVGLWARRAKDDDFLVVSAGRGVVDAELILLDERGQRVGPTVPLGTPTDAIPERRLPGIPILLDLAQHVGLCGPFRHALADTLIGQLAALHSPRDLRITVLDLDSPGASRWGWVSMLPHGRHGPDLRHSGVSVGTQEGQHVIRQLADELGRRRAAAHQVAAAPAHHDVLIVDGGLAARDLPGCVELFEADPALGIHIVQLDRTLADLPSALTTVIDVGSAAEATLHQPEGRSSFTADLVSTTWASALAHDLAPLEDATPRPDSATLPPHSDLLTDAPTVPQDRTLDLVHLWRRGGSTRVPIGVGTEGTCWVDLAADGPHALVAGTTGSGKSEFLQSLIAALALHNRPDELSLVLIDYKGGSAFQQCAELPHTLGLVTDLDEHLTTRALRSLTAEIKRRERILTGVGAKDLTDYRADPTRAPIARLVIVVDEFKALADELPEFIAGLVRLAAVGRSLGIHLVLATQRPAGIVSADMRANLSLRVCLRVRDEMDSVDVLEDAAAARISDRAPGRAYLRGASGALVQFQTGYVGGRRADSAGADAPQVTLVDELGRPLLPVGSATPPVCGAHAAPASDLPVSRHEGLEAVPAAIPIAPTDLERIVVAARAASDALAVPIPPAPWLEPLPHEFPLALDCHADRPASGSRLTLGLLDDPDRQRQEPFVWDLEGAGHLGLAGSARTGATTAVRTVAAALASTFPPEQAHLHVISGSARLPAGVQALPHTGVVVSRTEPERIATLIDRLSAVVTQRQQAADRDWPWIVLAIDGWEAVAESLDVIDLGAPVEGLYRLLRDGLSVRLRCVVTGGRAVLIGKLADAICTRLVGRFNDPLELTLAGLEPGALPTPTPPGRRLCADDGRQVQLAIPPAEADPWWSTRPFDPAAKATERPLVLRPLPSQVTVAEVGTAAGWAIGVGGDAAAPIGWDHDVSSAFVVAGHRRSGRSTALLRIAEAWDREGLAFIAIAPRGGALERAVALPSCQGFTLSAEQGTALLADHPGALVVVDDVDDVAGSALDAALTERARGLRSHRQPMAVALDLARVPALFSSCALDLAREGCGLLLAPRSTHESDLFRMRITPSGSVPVGRGFLVSAGTAVPCQIAFDPPSEARTA